MFLRAVFDDAEALWKREFQSAGVAYQPARLTIFAHQVPMNPVAPVSATLMPRSWHRAATIESRRQALACE